MIRSGSTFPTCPINGPASARWLLVQLLPVEINGYGTVKQLTLVQAWQTLLQISTSRISATCSGADHRLGSVSEGAKEQGRSKGAKAS